MSEVNDKKLAKAFDDSLDVISHRLNSHSDEAMTKGEQEQLQTARLVFTTYPKIVQAQSQRAAVGIKILHAASENDGQYRDLVREHMPRIAPLIIIPHVLDAHGKTLLEVKEDQSKLIATSLAKEKEYKDKIDELEFENMQLKEKAGG